MQAFGVHGVQAVAQLGVVAGEQVAVATRVNAIVWHATDAKQMGRLLAAWMERSADPYLPRTLARRLRDAGFHIDRRDVLVLLNPEYDPNTYSVANGEIMADFAVAQGRLALDEVNAWTQDLYRLGEEGLYCFSLNRVTSSSRTGSRNQHGAWDGAAGGPRRESLDLPHLAPGRPHSP